MPVFQRSFTATRIDTCSSLVCTKCLTECIAASGVVSCPCCSDDDPSHVRPASNAILLCCYQMLEDIVLVATWTLEVVIMKGMSVYHHPFTFPGGDEIKGAPLVYIPHLVDKVVLNENER